MKANKVKTRANQMELRYHGNSSLLDEIVAQNAVIHIEQMSDDCFWMGIETKKYVSFNFFPIMLLVQEQGKQRA